MVCIAVFGFAGSAIVGDGEGGKEGRILHPLAIPENNIHIPEKEVNVTDKSEILS